jgi:O-antigen/teichoic acid export membrane protein
LIRVVLVSLLLLTYSLDLLNAFVAVAGVPFIVTLVGLVTIPWNFLRAKGDERGCARELLHFGKWILVSLFCVMIFSRLGIFMLGYYGSPEEVGYFSAAYTFAMVFPVIAGTITTILLPKVAQLSSSEQMRFFVRKSLKFTMPIVIPSVILLFLSQPIIDLAYGLEFLPSVTVFQILVVSFSFAVIINPVSLVIFSMNKPQILAYLNVLQLLLTFSANMILIPTYGAVGAAVSTLLVSLFGTLFIGGYVYSALRIGRM